MKKRRWKNPNFSVDPELPEEGQYVLAYLKSEFRSSGESPFFVAKLCRRPVPENPYNPTGLYWVNGHETSHLYVVECWVELPNLDNETPYWDGFEYVSEEEWLND